MNELIGKCLVPTVVLILLAAGGNAPRAQSHGAAKTRASKNSTAKSKVKTIRARAGESVTSVAQRAGVDAEELASLNNLSVKSKLRRGQSLLLPDDATAAGTVDEGLPNGKLIKFADGGTLHVDSAWWRGEELWYSRGAITETISRKVKSVEPIFVARVAAPPVGTPPAHIPAPETSANKESETWIYLVGGAHFKVDEVDKTKDGAWYRRGSLLSFLEASRIERIERETPGSPTAAGDQSWTSGNSSIDQLIKTNGGRFGVDPYLVFLVIEQESHFHTRALSPKGARGLMQLMPGTARRFGVRRPFDPVENIRGGTQYLKELLGMFNGRVDLALASYNAGEGRVISYGNRVPPFQETQNYVRRINTRYKKGSAARKAAEKPAKGSGVRADVIEDRP